MLRAFLISLSRAYWAQRLVTRWSFAWRMASRFVSGETLADALRVTGELNAAGLNVTLDHLGEHTTTVADAERATAAILTLLDVLGSQSVRANVSIKLTQIGLTLGESLCAENLERILQRARLSRTFVRIDMEDSPCVDSTLHLYRRARAAGFEHLGVVIQAYLYRAEADVRALLEEGAFIRLVKGAYREPPALAYPRKADVNANFDRLACLMLEATREAGAPSLSPDGRIPPRAAFGTHDESRLRFICACARRLGLPPEAIEFQMLYGIRRDLQVQLARQGYPLRVYVPYGTHWYPYLMRRLAERPANLWFFLSHFVRR